MDIRREKEDDYFDVENMVRNAFWNVYRPGAFEHLIVHNLRNHSSFIKDLAYVIEENDEIIGHINYSYGTLNYENGKSYNAAVLGPIAIDGRYQNQGLGSKLIEFTLTEAKNKDIPFVFVVGDENYYSRFGFESASKYNLYLEGTDTNEECPFFMIKTFNKDKISSIKGIFSNPDVFDVDEKELEEFDEKFEFKQKEVNDNQLNI